MNLSGSIKRSKMCQTKKTMNANLYLGKVKVSYWMDLRNARNTGRYIAMTPSSKLRMMRRRGNSGKHTQRKRKVLRHARPRSVRRPKRWK